MRPGLVLAGGLVIVLGVALVLLGLTNLPHQSPTQFQYTSIQDAGILPGEGVNVSLVIPPSAVAPIQAAFEAAYPVRAALVSCPPLTNDPPFRCVAAETSGPVATGLLTVNGSLGSEYYLVFYNGPGNPPNSVRGEVRVPLEVSEGLPLWESGLIAAVGLFLLVVGFLAFYVGLFLRGNPYRSTSPREPTPQDASGKWSPPSEEEVRRAEEALARARPDRRPPEDWSEEGDEERSEDPRESAERTPP